MAWLSTTTSTAATSSISQSIIGTNVNAAEVAVGYNYNRCSKHHFLPSSSSASIISTINYPKLLSTTTRRRRTAVIRAEAESQTPTQMATTTIEKSGIKIVKNPPESSLSELGVRNWPKWGCAPSKFPWTYSSKETCYLLKGKVKVYPDGSDEVVEIGAGDLVEFPNAMSCTWDVSEAVDKHYKFD